MSTDLSGTWHNEDGSRMEVEARPDGRLTGRFVTGVGVGAGEAYALTGFVSDELVAFTVDFGRAGSLTSWAGHLVDEDGPALRTLWQMAVKVPHPEDPQELWRAVWSGANVFRREPLAPARGRRRQGPPAPLWTP